jgi:hypothetical protein
MGAMPVMVFTLFARPLPANSLLPAASCMSTHESAEKLNRRRARPVPAVGSVSAAAAGAREAAAAGGRVGVGSAEVKDGAGEGSAEPPADGTESLPVSDPAGRVLSATGSSFTGTAACRCHGFHQNSPIRRSTAAA